MILLDTHIWVWWINDSTRLKTATLQHLDALPPSDVAVSIISCWEVAKLVEKGRIELPASLDDWFQQAIQTAGIRVIPLDIELIQDACQLPQPFHTDPADQLIVATARTKNLELLTVDHKILSYPHVKLFSE